jgi:hypothetical protein
MFFGNQVFVEYKGMSKQENKRMGMRKLGKRIE